MKNRKFLFSILILAIFAVLVGCIKIPEKNTSGQAIAGVNTGQSVPGTTQIPLYRCLLPDKSVFETLDNNCEGLTDAKSLGVFSYVNKNPVTEERITLTEPIYRCIRGNTWVYVTRNCDPKSEDDSKSRIKNSFLGNIYKRPFLTGGNGWGDVNIRSPGSELVHYCVDKRGRWYFSFDACQGKNEDYGLPDRKGHLGGFAYMNKNIYNPCDVTAGSYLIGTECKTPGFRDGYCEYNKNTKISSCVYCPAGINGQTGLCETKCTRPGQISDSSTGQCKLCNGGQIQKIKNPPTDGMRVCDPCPTGKVSSKDRTKCIDCPKGTSSLDGSEEKCKK